MEGKLSCTEQRGWILSEFVYIISVVITTHSRDYHSGIHGSARRKSLAEKFYEGTSEEEDGEEGTWLVLYDFKGVKPNPRFWANVRRLMGLVGGSRLVQYSVFMTGSREGAIVAGRLVRHYGGEVVAFKGEEVELPS